MRKLLVAALVACGGSQEPQLPIVIANAPPPPSPTAAPTFVYANLTNAGADTCRAQAPIPLGEVGDGRVAMGFGARGGLAAWKPDNKRVTYQLVAADGTLGRAVTAPLDPTIDPKYVIAIDFGFVVLSQRWDWRRHEGVWWGQAIGRDGTLGVLRNLDASNLDFIDGQWRVEGNQIEAKLAPTRTEQGEPWRRLTIDPATGEITPAPATPLELAADPDDLVIAMIFNTATPPPVGAGGRIREALPVWTLSRENHGTAVGRDFELDAESTYVNQAVWSGTYFIVPIVKRWSGDRCSLLVIDCS